MLLNTSHLVYHIHAPIAIVRHANQHRAPFFSRGSKPFNCLRPLYYSIICDSFESENENKHKKTIQGHLQMIFKR